MIMMSAGAGQEALDSLSATDSNPNSVYTRTLLPLLKEPGLEITDLAKRLRGSVEALAATVRHEQRPAFYHELSGDFYLVPPKPVVAASVPPASEAAVAWGATKDTTSPAVLEAFVKQFDGTVYAGMARARIEELRRTQSAAVAASPVPPKTAPLASPVAPAPAAKPPTTTAPSIYDAAQAWATARETKNPVVLEDFLGRFGDTIYGSMARDRLQQLKNSQVAVVAPAAPAKPPAAATAPAAPAMATAPVGRMPAPGAASPAVGIFSNARPATPLSAAEEHALKPQDSFSECAHCPEMVVIPAGNFLMGSPAGEEGRMSNEGPQSAVTFAHPFAVGKYAVTFEQWDACVAAGGCNGYRPNDDGRPRDRYPVVNVSWEDAQAYVAWLSKSTGKTYRLLSEPEREYATRAGTDTPFWWGASISSKQANYDGSVSYGGGEKGEFRQRALPVDSFAPNAFGLYQMHGNVQEWVADCWRSSHQNASTDGVASNAGDCGRRALRGGSWYDGPQLLRAAARSGFYPAYRSNKIGFRIARSL
jgi:formylglycine-generating enzyme required for sulfatase activity